MKNIKISNHVIGDESPVYIIAEACDNHLGQIDKAIEMARLAKLAGASAVKYQHHLPDEEMLPETPMSSNMEEPLYDFLKKYSLTLDDHKKLLTYCENIGITYLCTPFSYKAAEELNSIGVPAFKIGSGEMTDIPSLTKMATLFKKPMIVSTGMSTFEEIDVTYNALLNTGVQLAFTNCISEYPPSYEDMNLKVISLMKTRYPNAIIGHSDHTPDLFTSFAAVALGAKIIEKHVILDKRQPGPDQSVSIDFNQFANLVEGIRKIESSLGSEKFVHSKENEIRTWAFRSVVTTRPLPVGHTLEVGDIWTKRPGTGIPSAELPNLIGKKLLKSVEGNVLLSWDDVTN